MIYFEPPLVVCLSLGCVVTYGASFDSLNTLFFFFLAFRKPIHWVSLGLGNCLGEIRWCDLMLKKSQDPHLIYQIGHGPGGNLPWFSVQYPET